MRSLSAFIAAFVTGKSAPSAELIDSSHAFTFSIALSETYHFSFSRSLTTVLASESVRVRSEITDILRLRG
jgi:hypothetical protein